MNALLETLLSEFNHKLDSLQNSFTREIALPKVENKIHVAIGMRRVGKSYFLLQQILRLAKQNNIPLTRFLYIDFEDDRLLPCKQTDLKNLLEGFYQLYPENHDEICYLFLDEIQNVKDWAIVIRRFFNTKKANIYLSGSSAKLLSKEIATSLRGRSIATEIFPYSFKEFLGYTNVKLSGDLFSKQNQDILFKNLKHYLHEGGFPETLAFPKLNRKQLLQDYVGLVIMKDIIERYKISNISLIKYIIGYLLKNPSTSLSINKLCNDIKSQGFSGAKNTIYDYLQYIEDAYLSFSVPLYSESVRKTQTNPKKIYAIDTGLTNAFSFSINHNYGHLFENLFYLDLRRKNHKIYYYLTKERYEIDFLTEDPMNRKKLYQVVWDTENPETMKREMRALSAAEKELGIKGELITPETYLRSIFKEIIS
ncbi:MAG: ATP-binding protein [Gammaproteobacteria bacterium]